MDHVAALDAVLQIRDPFPVVNSQNLLIDPLDPNTRVLLLVQNLQGGTVKVGLLDAAGQIYDLTAEDVRPVPDSQFVQVIFRLPSGLAVGRCRVIVRATDEFSNVGSMVIRR